MENVINFRDHYAKKNAFIPLHLDKPLLSVEERALIDEVNCLLDRIHSTIFEEDIPGKLRLDLLEHASNSLYYLDADMNEKIQSVNKKTWAQRLGSHLSFLWR